MKLVKVTQRIYGTQIGKRLNATALLLGLPYELTVCLSKLLVEIITTRCFQCGMIVDNHSVDNYNPVNDWE